MAKREVNEPIESVSFLCGEPDWRYIPLGAISKTLQAVMRYANPKEVLGYSDPQGSLELREAIADIVAPLRGVQCTPEEVMITGGSQQAFSLLLEYQRTRTPNPNAVFEEPGYTGPRKTAMMKGLNVHYIPVDSSGAVPEERTIPLNSLVFLTPNHQFPTGVSLSEDRRYDFLEIAERENAILVEDDYLAPFTFVGQPSASLWSRGLKSHVVYVGSFSKTLAPGLRIGYLIASYPLVRALANIRWRIDRHSPQIIERVVAGLVKSGLYTTHEIRMQSIYSHRWHTLRDCTSKWFGYISDSHGGLSLWVPLDLSWGAVQKGLNAAVGRGVIAEDSSRWYANLPRTASLRLGITSVEHKQIEMGVAILAECLGISLVKHQVPGGRHEKSEDLGSSF